VAGSDAVSELDCTALTVWLRSAVSGFKTLERIERFSGGQSNPTYRLETSNSRYVLRRKPFGDLLSSAHAVDREYRLLTALYPTGFPVPQPIAYCDDPTVIGSVFYLMSMVEGRTLWDGTLPDVPSYDRNAHYHAIVDTLASLHKLDHRKLGLEQFGAPGNYFRRQVDRWTKQYRASQTDNIPEIEHLIEWLPQSIPDQTHTAIIHGDYRIDNLIFARDNPSVRAVLDWELATIGDPLADFAYLAMHWILPRDGKATLAGSSFRDLGLPTLDQITGRYCAQTGRDSLPDLHWYFAYNLFRLVGIGQGIKKRLAAGNASSPAAAQAIERLVPLAQAAWAEARKAGAEA
jgi:aminoglycoside phosphotransferase (APT) family kinase protein